MGRGVEGGVGRLLFSKAMKSVNEFTLTPARGSSLVGIDRFMRTGSGLSRRFGESW